jgi:hypothetical protein
MYKVVGADQREYGPVGPEQIQQWIQERRLNGQSLAQAEGAERWQPLSEFPEFHSALAQYAPSPDLTPASAGLMELPRPPRTNVLAMLGLIMGLFSISIGCCCCYGLPFNVLGLVFSVMGLSQIHQNPERESGKGLALAGLILCLLSFVLGALAFFFGIAFSHQDFLREFRP